MVSQKKKKGKEVIIMLKKKLVQVTAAAMAATMLFSVPAMAKKNFFSFNVKTSVNDGEAFSAGNPKNDAERQAYVVTQDSNIISTDAFYYAVFNYPKDTARLSVCLSYKNEFKNWHSSSTVL